MKRLLTKIKTPDNFLLDAIFTRVENSNKGIIFAHGMTVDKEDEGIFVKAEPELNKLGFSTLRFDFRSHGKSHGNSATDFTISGELKDLETAVNFMFSKDVHWLGLAGASFGGGISSLYAGINPQKINALFLANPAIDYVKCFLNPTTPWAKEHFKNALERSRQFGFIEVGSRKFKMGTVIFEEMINYSPCESLKKYFGPLMIVHGDKDSKVSYQDVIECFSNLPNKNKQLEIVKGSEHGFHEEPFETKVMEMIINFFKKY